MLTYRIDRAQKLVLLTGSGELSAAEVLSVQQLLRDDPGFDPGFALLADYREVTQSDLDAVNMRQIAANVPFDPAVRRAFVVRGEHNYGIARMFESFSDLAERGGRVRAFLDLEAAVRWLRETPPAAPA